MKISLLSFGFKYGAPKSANIILDVRFLTNPFFDPKLKRYSGKAASIQNFVLKNKGAVGFIQKTLIYLKFLIPLYQAKDKPSLTVALGCTGGRHRSVALVELMQKKLVSKNIKVIKIHRDIHREA